MLAGVVGRAAPGAPAGAGLAGLGSRGGSRRGLVRRVLLRDDRHGRPWSSASASSSRVPAVAAHAARWPRSPSPSGTLLAFDIARIVAVDATGLWSIAGVLVLPYALLRWGAGREAALGLGIILIWLPVTLVVDPTSPAERVAGYGFFLFSAALGAAVRYRTSSPDPRDRAGAVAPAQRAGPRAA